MTSLVVSQSSSASSRNSDFSSPSRNSNQSALLYGSGIPTQGGEAAQEQSPDEKFCVEYKTKVCDSITWKMLKNYYSKMSIQAWSHNYVPSFVTSNSRLARSYSRIILNYLKDWFQNCQGTPDQPVHILEIGAGHGRFTLLLLKALLRYKDLFSSLGLPCRPFVYVFSDIAEANISFCKNHFALKKYANEGWLDFAFFDGNTIDTKIHLINRNSLIPEGGPIVVIANYVLDSLLTDAWRIDENGNFYRGLISVYSPIEESDRTNPDIMTRMTLRWDYELIDLSAIEECAVASNECSVFSCDFLASDYVLRNAKVLKVLNKYKELALEHQTSMSFVLPVGAFQLFDTLYRLSGKKIMCLVGDKGYPSYDEFVGYSYPHIAIHGSMSFMVNLHAIKLFFDECLCGFSMSTPYKDTFQLTCLWAGGDEAELQNLPCAIGEQESAKPQPKSGAEEATTVCSERAQESKIKIENTDSLANIKKRVKALYSNSQCAMLDDLEDMAPDSLLNLQKCVIDLINIGGHPSIKQLISILRYSGHDPDVLWNFRNFFTSQCIHPNACSRTDLDFLHDIKLVYQNWYKLRIEEDIPDLCAQICMRLKRCDEAIFYFKESLKYCNETLHPSTYINMSACYRVLNLIPEALDACKNALALAPNAKEVNYTKIRLSMCLKPFNLAFIGCGMWSRFEAGQLLRSDNRCRIVGVYAFCKEDAKNFHEFFSFDENETKIFYGNEGLTDLLTNHSVHACILDVHPQNLKTMIEKIWFCGIHVLTRSPLTFSVNTALSIADVYIMNYGTKIAWSIVANSKTEAAFGEANELLQKIGSPKSFNIQYVTNSRMNTNKTYNFYDEKEFLASELVSCLTAMCRILNGSIFSLCTKFLKTVLAKKLNNDIQVVQNDNAVTKAINNNEYNDIKHNNDNENDKEENEKNKNDELSSCPSLAGWCKINQNITEPLKANNNKSNAILGSFFLSCCVGDNQLKYEIFGTNGHMTLKKTSSVWQICIVTDNGTKKELSLQCVGHQNSHDEWMNKLLRKCDLYAEHQTEKQNERNISKIENDEMISDYIYDCSLFEGIIASISKNGSVVTFDYSDTESTEKSDLSLLDPTQENIQQKSVKNDILNSCKVKNL